MKNPLGKLFSRRSIPKSDTPIPMNGSGGTPPTKTRKKRPIGLVIAIVFVLAGVVAGQRFLSISGGEIQSPTGSVIGSATKSQKLSLDRSFSFRAYNRLEKLTKREIGYTITSVERTDQIVIQGKRATAVNDKEFLIFNLKLTNEFDESLFLNTRNFIRVQPAGSDDKLAPEVHNDTVEIQPDSTKLTRVGMPVDKGQDEFTLFVGEIETQDKEAIEIKF